VYATQEEFSAYYRDAGLADQERRPDAAHSVVTDSSWGAPIRAPNFLVDRLTNGIVNFSPQAGVGTVAAPYSSTLVSYVQQMISQQGDAASNADSLNQGQQVVVNSLQQRFTDQSSVNIDEEMSNLLKLQTAYGANARVMTAIKDMLTQLMQM